MNQKTLDNLVGIVKKRLSEKITRFNELSGKMNEDYDWFFRYRAGQLFVVNLEMKHLNELLQELKPEKMDKVPDMLDRNRHYFLQKLVDDNIKVQNESLMSTLVDIHEKQVYRSMYSLLQDLRSCLIDD